MSELKPCPFCGGEVEIANLTVNGSKGIVRGNFECGDCGAKIALKAMFEIYPLDSLAKAWNRRHSDE